ncbi:MAG: cupin domain-containing protein [Candidatus Portnoybacteria bacterium]|nr:cupin domain-containing protein [Candidatus Portnoybacteria bacterium]
MPGFFTDIQKETLENNNFRKVLYTAANCQLVVMSLKPGEEIGEEVHEHVDQFFRIEKGKAKFILNGQETEAGEEWVGIVPQGTTHNVINISDGDLKLYTIYSPPNHPDGTIHATKAEATAAEEEEHM